LGAIAVLVIVASATDLRVVPKDPAFLPVAFFTHRCRGKGLHSVRSSQKCQFCRQTTDTAAGFARAASLQNFDSRTPFRIGLSENQY
jgi:hypothetical protein